MRYFKSDDSLEYPEFDYTAYRKRHRIFTVLRSDRPWLNGVLFLLTIASTYFIGRSWAYTVSIMSILFCHEMGHYLMARKHHIRATLPYFIPLPLPPFGTLGAIIRMEHVIPNRKALFDVGVAGPLAGLAVTIPVIIYGLAHSQIMPLSSMSRGTLQLGDSLLFKLLSYWVVGHVPAGYDVVLHPAAYAGWAGLLVTALNLMPVGQLDGGHVVYAIFGGKKSKIVFNIAMLGFIIIFIFFYWGWFLMVLFILLFGFKHPPPLDDFTPIGRGRVILGIVTFIIFFLSFTPVPFKM
ncbi:MAG TPA: site-2 protease family protein [Bacteroidetes bacterium]|nr:site-2 protease family protein [Bacteroidota bacterium]HDZ11662.1 site-2 protease family protein [Bacteroidota bacterium]